MEHDLRKLEEKIRRELTNLKIKYGNEGKTMERRVSSKSIVRAEIEVKNKKLG